MDVVAISSATTLGVGDTANSNASIRARILLLEQQLAQVQGNESLADDVKEQRIQAIEAQIQRLEAMLSRTQSSRQTSETSTTDYTTTTASTANASSETVGTLLNAYA